MYSIGNYIQYPAINHNGKEYEKVYIHTLTYRTETLCCTPETNTTLYINHISIKKERNYILFYTFLKISRNWCVNTFNRNSFNELNKTSTTVFCIPLLFCRMSIIKKKNHSPNKVMS